MMDTHFAVLPLDMIDAVASQLPEGTPLSPRFLRLPHPRTGIASLFLAYEPVPNENESDRRQVSKILEVQAVEPPNSRSWFIGDEVVSDGRLLVMTPVDPLFLLIPILRAIKQPDASSFRPAEDIFEDAARYLAEASVAGETQDISLFVRVEDIMKFAALDCARRAMGRLCDVKEITAEITVFRYSSEKLIQELRKKVATLSIPRVTELSRCMVRSLAKDALMEDKHGDLVELGRIRLACELLGQYLPHGIQAELLASYDLARLDAHVTTLAKERALLVSEKDVVRKSKAGPATVPGGSKKRKKEAKGSQGVEKLRKTNVSGMSKLSTFFAKRAE